MLKQNREKFSKRKKLQKLKPLLKLLKRLLLQNSLLKRQRRPQVLRFPRRSPRRRRKLQKLKKNRQ